ncbi:Dolichyl-phosphate-mannose-protein mannosyltransferase [uncultured Desulfobacterium sp.]|uniref:Dolichyl-phosphate-mannose-protein mannosyltransferase n=1 Tax=uncultured Desulfobacterium sp. TaxID=201089 RepID=A0A445MWQ3_9BACT|nr:Dolichyl-phosphate-mannose-protein mannosyltransferase [uncultured Desulfobacterium sp.]
MKKGYILAVFCFLLIYIIPLGMRPLFIRDESRYAEIPREMIATGDWIVPRLDGVRYFEKPVLGYWLNALAIKLFGENPFAVRLPSAISVGISALFIFFFVRKFSLDEPDSVGLSAAIAFITCVEVCAVGVYNVLDSVFSMFTTMSMVLFFLAHTEAHRKKRTALFALFGAVCGFGFLTKGFVAFAVPVAAIVPFMIWEGRWKELFKIAWLPIVAAVLVSVPWAVAIHLKEPDFWNYFFWEEHVRRFLSSAAQHPHPFWFFIPVMIVGAMPLTMLLPSAVLWIKEIRIKDSFIRFLICWFVFPFVFFSLSSGKLGTYILPCFPPFAIFIMIGVRNYLQQGRVRAVNLGALVFAALISITALTLIVVQVIRPAGLILYQHAEGWKWMSAASAVLISAMIIFISSKKTDINKRLISYAAAQVLILFCAHFVIPDKAIAKLAPQGFLLSHQKDIPADGFIVSDCNMSHHVCWTYKRNGIYLLEHAGEFQYGLDYDDSGYRLLTIDRLNALINEVSKKQPVTIITQTRRYLKYRDKIPKPLIEDIGPCFVFARF